MDLPLLTGMLSHCKLFRFASRMELRATSGPRMKTEKRFPRKAYVVRSFSGLAAALESACFLSINHSGFTLTDR